MEGLHCLHGDEKRLQALCKHPSLGEDRVYLDRLLTNGSQRVVQVWRGAINLNYDALRLLLIIDYIFDWARDIYREGVIRSLRKLAISDSRSLAYQDSDILSTVTQVEKWVITDQHRMESTWSEEQETAGVKDALRSFDTRQGVIRDIRYIQSRFVGLHINQDNLGAFLKSTSSEKKSKQLAVSLLTHLLEGWRVKGETLTALESDWTGKDRGLEYQDQEATFLVVATVAAYLTTDWEQTRELSYIAVEEGAMDRLLKYTGLRMADGDTLSDFPFVDKAAFSDILLVLRRQPAGANLLACISRVCLSTGILSTKNDEHKDVLSVTSVERSGQGLIYRADTVLKPDMATKRDFVRKIYTEHKIGRNEPFCPFLRVSSVLDELGLSLNSPPLSLGEIQHSRWFKRTPDILEIPDHGVLIATSSNPNAGPITARLCLFVTNPAAVRTSGSPFRELVRSEPPWLFRSKTYCDKERGGSNRWNCEFEKYVKYVTRDEPILPRLKAFVEALETLEARSPQGQAEADADVNKDNTEQAWAPKKPNSMWDVLLAPGLEFMSDEDDADAYVLDNPQTYPTTADNPRNIRQVNREDTPRPSVEPTSKGKQPEVIQQRGFSYYCVTEGNGSPGPQGSRSIRSLTTMDNPLTRPPYGVRDDSPGPSSSVRAARRKTPETESPSPPPKRQRSSSPPHPGPVREALPHRGLTPMQTAGRELDNGTLLHTSQLLPFYSANCGSRTDPIVIL